MDKVTGALQQHQFNQGPDVKQIGKGQLDGQINSMNSGNAVNRGNHASTVQLINTASEGMILKGVLFDKGNFFELSKDRQQIIQVVGNV